MPKIKFSEHLMLYSFHYEETLTSLQLPRAGGGGYRGTAQPTSRDGAGVSRGSHFDVGRRSEGIFFDGGSLKG